MYKNKQQEPEPGTTLTEQTTPVDTTTKQADTTATIPATDTTRIDTTAAANTIVPPVTTIGSFQLLIDQFKSKAQADKRIASLKIRGFDAQLNVKDSTTFQVILPVNRPLSDTTYVMDSLRRYYLWKPKLIK